MTTPSEIDTINDHLVGMQGDDKVVVLLPPTRPMDRDEALRLAAWLAVCADLDGDRFDAVLQAVRNT